MGMDLGMYVKVTEKSYDFVPGQPILRATQEVRKILATALNIDFANTDYDHYSWDGKELEVAIDRFSKVSGDIDFYCVYEMIQFFKKALLNGYNITLI